MDWNVITNAVVLIYFAVQINHIKNSCKMVADAFDPEGYNAHLNEE